MGNAVNILTYASGGELEDGFYDLTPDDAPRLKQQLNPEHAFFKRGGREHYVVACRGDQVVARCAAILSPGLADGDVPTGLIGFFASDDDIDAGVSVLEMACQWLKEQGMPCVRGPMDRDTWHRYRLMTAGFQREAILMEPVNPAWYPDCFAGAGFEICARYCSTLNRDVQAVAERHAPFLRRCLRRGYRLEPLDMQHYKEALSQLYRISLDAFADNFSYAPISEREFMELYLPYEAVIDPRLVGIAYDPGNVAVGYFFGIPERPPHTNTMNFKTVCVVPAARRRGLGEAMVGTLYKAALDAGFTRSRHCLMIHSNASRRYDEGLGEIIKEYALYERPL